MNWKWKQKWLISQAVIITVLFFSVLPAAATESVGQEDTQPAVIEHTKSEAEANTDENVQSEMEAKIHSDSQKDISEDTESVSEDSTLEDTESNLEDTESNSEDTEPDSEEGTLEDAGSNSEEGTSQDAESDSEEGTLEDAGSNSEEGTSQDAESDSEEGTLEDAESDSKEGAKDDLSENSKGELPANMERPDHILSKDFASGVHKCSWSMDWDCDESYHWHECDAKNCPLSANSEKEGYAEHCYEDDNICTECGYVRSDNGPARAAGVVPTYQEAYEAMIALKDNYPEGMTWTNFTPYGSQGNLGASYVWNGGKVYGANSGVGCSAFAFILSDTAFGNLPARVINGGGFTFEDVKVGDILRVNGNIHSVIVLQKSTGGVIIAEANYNKSVHWGRAMSKEEVLAADYIITRYPDHHVPSDKPGADEVVKSGTEGSLSWSLTKAGILTISGKGMMPDYSPDHLPPWYGCSVGAVIIENGVTSIGNYAFYQSTALSIYIPGGIVKIGQNAFYESGLISVTIPGTVESIEDHAFHNCKNLTSVSVSKGVKTIGSNAFRGCTSLLYIDFPTSITSVGAGAFMSCEKMVRVRFMPGSKKTALGDNLFSQCWNLTSVTLPQTADCISSGMFESCSSLLTLYIPASVTNIGQNPFNSCNALKFIYFGGTEAEWKSMLNPYLQGSLQSIGTTVICNAIFDDPFAPDPDDPGDFWPDEDEEDPDHNEGVHKHRWSKNWSYDKTCHWHECSAGCSLTDNRDKNGYGTHSYDSWVIDADATSSRRGSRHRDCTICGYRQTAGIPADDSNDNDDSSNGSGGSNDNSSNGNGGGSNGNDDGSNGNGGSSNDNDDDSNGNGGGSNDNSSNGSDGSSNNNNANGSSNDNSANGNGGSLVAPVSTAGTTRQAGSLDDADLKETKDTSNKLSEDAGRKQFPDSEREPEDTENLPSQNPKETETASEGDESKIPYASDEDSENVSKSDKGNTNVIIPVLSVFGCAAVGSGLVFMRKRNKLKK